MTENSDNTHDQEPEETHDHKVIDIDNLDIVYATQVTPNGKFLITAGLSIAVGWNVEDVDDKGQLKKSEFEVDTPNFDFTYYSDNKKVVAISKFKFTGRNYDIYYMDNNQLKKINTKYDQFYIHSYPKHCRFTSVSNINRLCKFMKHPNLCSLLIPSLLVYFKFNDEFWNSIMENFWEKCIEHLKQNGHLPHLPKEVEPRFIEATKRYAFIDTWRIDLKTMISSINSLFTDENVKDVDNLHIPLRNSYMDVIYELFHEVEVISELSEREKSLGKWSVKRNYGEDHGEIYLVIYRNNVKIGSRYFKIEKDHYDLIEIKILDER
ncbi:unnamed protein product [Rhizophagus irregularis]|nr:unnamed protein product [Rhizophagus irregularis]